MTLALILTAAALAMTASAVLVLARRRPAPGPRLTGRTVVLERAGRDVMNLRGVVLAQHQDRWTLGEAQAIAPEGDMPLEHAVVHVPVGVVLSISEIPGDA